MSAVRSLMSAVTLLFISHQAAAQAVPCLSPTFGPDHFRAVIAQPAPVGESPVQVNVSVHNADLAVAIAIVWQMNSQPVLDPFLYCDASYQGDPVTCTDPTVVPPGETRVVQWPLTLANVDVITVLVFPVGTGGPYAVPVVSGDLISGPTGSIATTKFYDHFYFQRDGCR